MAIMRIISRLILHNSSQSSLPRRWLSTAAAQPESRNALFRKVIDASSKSSVVDVMNECVAGGEIVTKSDFLNLISHFRSRKNFRASLQLYEWLDCSNLQRGRDDEAAHIHLLGRVEGSAYAEKYFNSLKEKSKKTYSALLSCYCKDLALDKALEIFAKINELCYSGIPDYKNMLSLYYNLEHHERVVSLVQELEERNIAPDTYTYNMLINSHVAMKNLDAIDGVLEKMETANVKRNRPTYIILVTAYWKSGMHEKASAFLELMEQMEIKKGDAKKVCLIRVRLYSMMKDPAGVIRAWEDLKSDEPKPNNNSYLYVLVALSRLGDHGNLEKIFKEWEEGCTVYDYRLPNVLLEYYLSRNMVEEATLLYKRLVDKLVDRGFDGSDPSLRTLELFAILCLRKGEIDLAMEYLEKGLGKVKSRESSYPRNETIEEFIRYFEEKSDRERGGKFVESMKKQNRLQSDSLLSYIALLKGVSVYPSN